VFLVVIVKFDYGTKRVHDQKKSPKFVMAEGYIKYLNKSVKH